MRKVNVDLGERSYDIRIGSGILKEAGVWLREMGLSGKAVIVTNPGLVGLYGDTLKDSLSREGFGVSIFEVPEGEQSKCLETVARLYGELSNIQAERQTPVLALGGGVIGDLAGFTAATYVRGVPLIQVPTTLLAQVDSGIGGKCAVDHGRLKNKVGAFYQPKLVISDIDTLKTLAPREMSSSLAEVIKTAIIGDRDLFSLLETSMDDIRAFNASLLEEIVERSSKIKADIVSQDERDLHIRNVLNLGHTIGHAIEAVSEFRLTHGEAVAIGTVAAGRISNKKGILNEDELSRIRALFRQAALPVSVPNLAKEKLLQAMKHDKKVRGGRIRMILPRAIGDVFITDEIDTNLIEEVLSSD